MWVPHVTVIRTRTIIGISSLFDQCDFLCQYIAGDVCNVNTVVTNDTTALKGQSRQILGYYLASGKLNWYLWF
jgi:hypothetical protein